LPRDDLETATHLAREWPAVGRGIETVQKMADESANVLVVAQYLAREETSDKSNPLHLKIPVVAEFEDGTKVDLLVLLDTGAEVNIIKRSLVPPGVSRISHKPIRFVMASSEIMAGGERDSFSQFSIRGKATDTSAEAEAILPITWYEADIAADAIVSLAWMSRWNIDVRSRNHGVMIKSTNPPIWVKGCSHDGRIRTQDRGEKQVTVIATAPVGPAQPRKGYGKKKTKFRIPLVTAIVPPKEESMDRETEDSEIREDMSNPIMLDLFSGTG